MSVCLCAHCWGGGGGLCVCVGGDKASFVCGSGELCFLWFQLVLDQPHLVLAFSAAAILNLLSSI